VSNDQVHRTRRCLIPLDIDGPDAITKHYDLLSAIMRVICAALLSRGPQNEISLDQGRRFLMDNRLSTLAVLKKSAGLGLGTSASTDSIIELAECYMILINVTGFLDVSSRTTRYPFHANKHCSLTKT
jgi:nuclear pore complex protein Nup205